MRITSALAITASMIGAAGLSTPAPAQRAQPKKAEAQAEPAGPKRTYTKGAQKALQELQTAANANDVANFPAKLAAAEAAAKNPDDRYFIAQMRLSMAIKAQDRAAQRAAIDAVLRSGGAQPDELGRLYRAQGGFAIEAKDYDGAIAAYNQALKISPNDPDIINNMIIIHRDRKQHAQALALVQQSIAARKAASQPVPENLYLLGLQTALDGNIKGQMLPLTRELLTAYPTQKNWQNGIAIYRQSVTTDDEAALDTFRLMRAAKALQNSNEYIALADNLARDRYYAEARDVINEGVTSGKLKSTNASASAILKEVSGKIAGDRTALAGLEGRARSEAAGTFALKIAEGYYGHGDWAKAAEFYRLALQKGSVDSNLVNTRLGMALAQSGRKAEAETAFKAVGGSRADLAGLWMLWLNRQA